MVVSNTFIYLKKLVKDGHKWQYTDLLNNGKSPRFYFSKSQWIFLLISVVGSYKMDTGYNAGFVGYIISALSIFVGLFLTLLLSIFDKFQNLREISQPTEIDKVYLLKRKNFFKQFTALTSYAIFISLICICLLSGILISEKYFAENIFDHPVIFNIQTIKFLNVEHFIYLAFLEVYNVTISYFLLDFILIVFYAVASIHTYMMIEYNRSES